jgi:ketosteroid isomerase-like protein
MSDAQLTAADQDEIEAVTKEFVQKMLDGDRAGLSRLYTHDSVVMPPNHGTVAGQAGIQAFLDQFPKVTKFVAVNDDIDGRGDIAYVRGSYTMTLELPDGSSVDDEGTYLEIRRRQRDGSWPIAIDTFCSNLEV